MFKGSPLPPGLISATSVWHSRSSVPLRHGGFGLIINFFSTSAYCSASTGLFPTPLHLCTPAPGRGSPSTWSTSLPPSTPTACFLPPSSPLIRVLSVGQLCKPRLPSGSCLAVLTAGLFVHADFHKLPDVRDCASALPKSPCPAQCLAQSWSCGAECIKTGSRRTCWLRGREITASQVQEMAPGEGLQGRPHSDSVLFSCSGSL